MTPHELRQWRHDNGNISPLTLASGLGVDRNTVYRWENGATPIPDDVPDRLIKYLISVAEAQEATPHTVAHDLAETLVLESEQPHGSVIGLTQAFWRDKTDQERVEWILAAENPLLALPWPWWSHGWEWYPIKKISGRLPRQMPHYLVKHCLESLKVQMTREKGETEDMCLRQAVIFFCRRDFPFWLNPDGSLKPLTRFDYAKLQKIMGEPKENS